MSFLMPPLPPTFEAALRDVHGKRPESRLAAAERLGRAEEHERTPAIEGLKLLTRDSHAGVRAAAISGLGALAAEEALDTLLTVLAQDESAQVRELATIAVAQVGGQRAAQALREALRSDTPQVRFQAIAAVAELLPKQAAQELAPLLNDPDPEVRTQAVSGLAAVSEPHLAGHFAGALHDDSVGVRLEAALALAALGDKRGEPVLLEALTRRERVIEVAEALARLASSAAREPLARLAGGLFTSPYVRAGVGAALVRLDDPRGVQALRRVLTGLRADARSYAVDLVRETGTSQLVPELTRLSERPRGADLLTVVDALATFAPNIEPARRALSHLAARRDDVGERARAALGA